ncbi:MAG: extracellular solute-binding protein [Verrucomicrobia bacterium]|nr:extracellular solute-binding protein [Verrucomicrobiota bacterium]
MGRKLLTSIATIPDSVQRRPGALEGLAWNHSRGYVPLVATAQRFEDLGYGEIRWQKRSLRDFGDQDLEQLALNFDLLVIDHPHVGRLASAGLIEPLEDRFENGFLADLETGSVGRSFDSYWTEERLWALPIDAAAPVSSWRPDLMKESSINPPETWEQLCDLARRGFVVIPATPVDSLMNLYMLCCGLGEQPFSGEAPASYDIALEALQLLRELVRCCSPECLQRDPIQTYRAMVLNNAGLYCPFAFGYSNYCRSGYAPVTLEFGGLVTLNGRSLQSTLGGAGIAISRNCRNQELAFGYIEWIASLSTQQSIYFQAGGQPAHRAAWLDPNINSSCGKYFRNTLETVDFAYLRPRYNGYVEFQNRAGAEVHLYLRGRQSAAETISAMSEAYFRSVEIAS